MSHKYERVLSHLRESCHTYTWVMSYIWMSHVAHTNESCHTYKWVMSHTCMSLVTRTNESCRKYEWVMSYKWMSHVAHTNESCRTYLTVSPSSSTRTLFDTTSSSRNDCWNFSKVRPLKIFLHKIITELPFEKYFALQDNHSILKELDKILKSQLAKKLTIQNNIQLAFEKNPTLQDNPLIPRWLGKFSKISSRPNLLYPMTTGLNFEIYFAPRQPPHSKMTGQIFQESARLET